MSVHQILDAAYPPSAAPDGVEAVVGYLDSPYALHPWPPAQWLPFGHLRQFPAWVANVTADPVAQAQKAVAQVLSLGWAPLSAGFTSPRVIILDMEASTDPAWYAKAAGVITAARFTPVAYGSLSTVLGNAAADVLAAAWDGVRAIPAGQTIHGGQYLANVPYAGTRVDYSLFDDWLFNRGGVGPRHQ
jgi:hypothetical protein